MSADSAAAGMPRTRLLVLTERLPRPDESSGSRRLLAVLTGLAKVADVHLWVERDEQVGRAAFPAARVREDRRRLDTLGVSVLPSSWRSLATILDHGAYDVVLFEMYDIAVRYLPVVRDALPEARLVVDSVDVHFARLATGAAVGAVPLRVARRVRRREAGIYRAADVVITVSSEDADQLAAAAGMPPLVTVPNCVEVRPRRPERRAPVAIFVGHFRHAPNLDGLQWFVHEGWARVRVRHPTARLVVIGSHAGGDVHALAREPGVDVLGYVEDLAPHLDRAAVAIAPLRFGAGMKGKVTDAMAAGLPVVTTPIGAQGLDAAARAPLTIADTPGDLADAISDLFDEPTRASALGLEGQQQIDRLCGPAAVTSALAAVLTTSQVTSSRPRPSASPAMKLWRRLRLAAHYAWWSLARRHARWLSPRETGLTGDTP